MEAEKRVKISKNSVPSYSTVLCWLRHQRTVVRQREQELHTNKQQLDLLLKIYMEHSNELGMTALKFVC